MSEYNTMFLNTNQFWRCNTELRILNMRVWHINKWFQNFILNCKTPVWTRWFKMRNRFSGRITMCVVKGVWNWTASRNNRGPRVGAWTGKLKNPKKCLALEPDRRSNFSFSPLAHLLLLQDYGITSVHWCLLCAVTCITEISLNVALSNKFTHSKC